MSVQTLSFYVYSKKLRINCRNNFYNPTLSPTCEHLNKTSNELNNPIISKSSQRCGDGLWDMKKNHQTTEKK